MQLWFWVGVCRVEDNKFLLVFGAVLVAFLGLPIVMQAVRGGPATAGTPGALAETAATPAQPAKEPPLLNAANLIGSEWATDLDGFPIKVTLAANGVAYASSPMAKQLYGVEYVEGKWTVNYDKVNVFVAFGGKEHSYDFEIVGDKLWYLKPGAGKPVEIKRAR